ncbi:MAG TPA: diacylglycerol kinase family protein [Clostridia bacterium]|nr:diacylglycerol kinase family protein [Clostridia bacterium]
MESSLRHVFIVNPTAGKGNSLYFINYAVSNLLKGKVEGLSVRVTGGPMDAAKIAAEEASRGDAVRLYACGGDGTLNEVANGAMGFDNAQIAPVPLGSGNDYVKTFGGRAGFLDLAALMEGSVIKADMIQCNGRYAINLCSMGFDSSVASNMARFKRLPLVNGSMAYDFSVVFSLLNNIRSSFQIVINDTDIYEGEFLLAVVANGKWYGGSYLAAPDASPFDGKLDFVLVRRVSRLKFLRLVDAYKRGEHEKLYDILHHYTGEKLTIRSRKPFPVNMDGETIHVSDAEFRVVPGAFNLVVPPKLVNTYKNTREICI